MVKILKVRSSVIELQINDDLLAIQQVSGQKLTTRQVIAVLGKVIVGIRDGSEETETIWERAKALHLNRKNAWAVAGNYGPSGCFYGRLLVKASGCEAAYSPRSAKLDISMEGKPYLEKEVWLGDLYPLLEYYVKKNSAIFEDEWVLGDEEAVTELPQIKWNKPGQDYPGQPEENKEPGQDYPGQPEEEELDISI